ncbi:MULTISPECIES: hypothetical protein [Methylobacterium]|uniref:hypothetical protein n=1 Tax=Methylobacterium TaxID=407 RepID=UPI0013EBD4D9|nr:hypothetical protein [Methylobacterium sp. DB0501]NGM32527.1 hypothetical protein [Methylobacterium sp. DB0501]
MVKTSSVRALIGAQKFDQALAQYTDETKQRGMDTKKLGAMKHEPDNSGMDIEQGREALANAAKRSYKLPRPEGD